MANIENKVEQLIEGTINNLGYDLYDVEYVKEAKNYFLRIYIDSEKGIDLNDCEKVNNAISDMLDEADYIKEQYFLEISSSGIERVLKKDKHLELSLNKKIEVNLFKPIDKNKKIIGILKNYDDENITLLIDNCEKIIPRKIISLMKTVYDWE